MPEANSLNQMKSCPGYKGKQGEITAGASEHLPRISGNKILKNTPEKEMWDIILTLPQPAV